MVSIACAAGVTLGAGGAMGSRVGGGATGGAMGGETGCTGVSVGGMKDFANE
ncbi:MAG: hypothetical protein V4436_01090 [Patescibacteria group bacterium]